jgi:2,4-dienoyl-CoA reductase-like NADH-dependent reductase (Old Yellow Enzyme family)
LQFSIWLKEHGVDLIDCSSGGLSPNQTLSSYPGYQVEFADTIKHEAQVLTGAVGLITEAEHAENILIENRADAIFIGRELLRNPYWPLNAAITLGEDVVWPDQYVRAKSRT